jgi:hypothetical protein
MIASVPPITQSPDHQTTPIWGVLPQNASNSLCHGQKASGAGTQTFVTLVVDFGIVIRRMDEGAHPCNTYC